MRRITDKDEARKLLSKYKFEMFNKKNNHEGEITTLDEKDIRDILHDMRLGRYSVKVEIDDNGTIFVKYPFNICTLESREEI